jgi:Type IV secretory pathway, VirB11 components, and related ATPases involved in archaeal flagella biosynthesis
LRTSVDGSVNQIRTANESLNDLNFSDLHKETAMEANLELVVEYGVEPPFSSVKIVKDIRTGTVSYIVNEPDVGREVAEMTRIARQILISNLKSFPRTEQERLNYLRKFLADFKKSREGVLSKIDLEKIFYLLQRELQGYGPVQVPVLDDNVEDISCVGPNAQIYVVHRKFGSISTNIEFENEDELDDFVRRIVQRSGKHISIAVPMVDCTMPNGARLQATLGREVTKNGSSFTIRRFREQPFTPLELIKIGTMSPEIAVYLWQAVEAGQNMFVIGGTATGKTTTLNSILLFVPPEKKLVSIEDTRELNTPHENWIQMLTRPVRAM